MSLANELHLDAQCCAFNQFQKILTYTRVRKDSRFDEQDDKLAEMMWNKQHSCNDGLTNCVVMLE